MHYFALHINQCSKLASTKINSMYQKNLRSGPYLRYLCNSVQTKVDETRQCIVQKESNPLSVLVHKGMFWYQSGVNIRQHGKSDHKNLI